MAKFCRIIELEDNEQVLLVMGYNEEDEMPAIEVSANFDGAVAQMKLSFKTEKSMKKAFNEFSIDSASKFRNEMASMFN